MRRRALVTGAAKRVGREIAVELSRSGFDVALHRRGSPLDEVADACRAHGAEVIELAADLERADEVQVLAGTLARRWDRLDLLVNNASLFAPDPFEAITLVRWQQMIAINLTAPFLLSQALLPQLRAAEPALVVHMCDIGADRPVRGYTPYSVSKAGLVMLVRSMAVELAPAVRTVGISPGHVVWPPDYDAATRERLARRIPMGRVGEASDVARLIRFLALEAPYLNGVVIPVDGGLACRY